MLGLKLPTDPRWVGIAQKNLSEILTDHAWCEQKATSMAITLIVKNPEKTELVNAMIELVKEEISHFQLVHDKIIKYNLELGPQRKDEYVNELMTFFPKGGTKEDSLVHMLLYAALIEARSCERFKLLSENIEDEDLSRFYFNLMKSEANHYTMFLTFARKYGKEEIVEKKWQELLTFEAEIMQKLGKKETMHG